MRRNNKGSAVVAVTVTVSFVAMLGVAVLFMSYMNTQIKNADRAARRNFYTVEQTLDVERAKLQLEVSAAIEKAYTAAMTSYADAEKVFHTHFVKDLYTRLGTYTIGGAGLTFAADNAVNIVSANDDALMTVKAFVITNYKVTHIDEDRYENTIYADFEITVPKYEAQSFGRYNRLSDYVIVADGEVTSEYAVSGGLNVGGNIYAGMLNVNGVNRQLNLTSGRVLCRGSFNISEPGAALSILGGAEIWVNRININGGSFTAEAQRGLYVADDMELRGEAANATVSGMYFGFGNSSDDSTKSSSIILNGSHARLDLSGLTRLQLAGRSFITNSATELQLGFGSPDIPMSSSVAARSDQRAFILPDKYLTYLGPLDTEPRALPNPSIYNAADTVTVDLTALQADFERLYNIKNVNYVERFYTTGAHLQLRYFFLTFASSADSDTYFLEYYRQNNELFQDYLNYTFNTDPSDGGANPNPGDTVASDGFYYGFAEGDGFSLRAGGFVPAMNYAEQYDNLVTTLRKQGDNPSPNTTVGTTAFDHFVRQASFSVGPVTYPGIDSLGAVTYFSNDSSTVAVIAKGDFAITNALPNLSVVIATGNVTVDRRFEGLIIAGGNVTLSGTIPAGASQLNDGRNGTTLAAFAAKNGDVPLLDYLQGSTPGASTTEPGSWNLNELVVYRNWSKNEKK